MPFTDSLAQPDSTDWITPDNLYQPINRIWQFTLDGAASHENAKCWRYCTKDGTYETRDRATGFPANDAPYDVPSLVDTRDGLTFPWTDERVFLNPPWGEPEEACKPDCAKKRCLEREAHHDDYWPGIADFLTKARDSVLRDGARCVVALFPARTDNAWFHDLIVPYAVPLPGWPTYFRRGRVQFGDPRAEQRASVGLRPRTGPPVGIGVAVYR